MKNWILYTLVVCAGIFGAGCTAREIGAGAIGVGIGIGIGRGHHHGDHHRHRRPPHHRCDRWGCWGDMEQANAMAASDASDLASRYQIPTATAAKLVDAFAKAETQGLTPFRALGLNDADFKAMVNHQPPSEQSVKTASQKLDLSEKQGRALLVAMTREFNKQAADVNSEYWQYCTADGSWKTEKNSSCKSLNWPGCGPQEGAKFCY